jgi:hypothetical protein
MDLRVSFRHWVDGKIGSRAIPALQKHLVEHDYRLYSFIEHRGCWQREVYHPRRGFFKAVGLDDGEALLGILRQIWLVEALHEVSEWEVGPSSS